jgi:hypothetical protein
MLALVGRPPPAVTPTLAELLEQTTTSRLLTGGWTSDRRGDRRRVHRRLPARRPGDPAADPRRDPRSPSPARARRSATITLDGRYVVYFAGFKQHVSLYPVPDPDSEAAAAVAPYRSGKGTVRFPLDRPVPLDLVARLAHLLADRRTAPQGARQA